MGFCCLSYSLFAALMMPVSRSMVKSLQSSPQESANLQVMNHPRKLHQFPAKYCYSPTNLYTTRVYLSSISIYFPAEKSIINCNLVGHYAVTNLSIKFL